MEITAVLTALKTFGPWIAGAVLLAGVSLLVVDRNHLAQLNNAHQACLASVQAKPGSKPIGSVCEVPIATAVQVATSAQACDAGLSSLLKAAQPGAPVVCSPAVLALAADRDVAKGEVANLNDQLNAAAAQTSQAVARAQARGTAIAQEQSHAQAVLAAAPRSGGLITLNADRLRELAGQSAAVSP